MNLKETVKNLQDKFFYLTNERFAYILKINGFSESQIKECMPLIGKGVTYFIAEAPEQILSIVLNYDFDLAWKRIEFEYNDNAKFFVKLIYKYIDSTEFRTEEIDLTSYEGNKLLVSFHENSNIEIIATCRMTDSISKKGTYLKVFEGDLISAQDWGYRKANTLLIIAFIDGQYIGGDAYYCELLWTDKYGYLAPKSSHKANTDDQPLLVTNSTFSVKPGRYNYHKITLNEDFSIIGNIHTHFNLLMPPKTA